jgi:hypothetical protein
VEFTKKLLNRGKNEFIVGLTDFHSGGDHLAALRDPQRLALDILDCPELIKIKLEESAEEYKKVYDVFYRMLRDAEMPITSWTPLIHDGRFYIPSNDFSCMISPESFNDIFLPSIRDECRFFERTIYHLDGPGALIHLDAILDIPELDAVQWVPGAGNQGYERWVNVYRRIQKRGKGVQLRLESPNELPAVFESLRPEGVWISHINHVESAEEAEEILNRVSAWR